MAEKLLIKNGVLFDGVDSEVKAGLTLEIENGIITYIGAERPASSDVKVIDAVGKFIMPGIIDCHMHIGKNYPLWYNYCVRCFYGRTLFKAADRRRRDHRSETSPVWTGFCDGRRRSVC